MPFRFRAKAVLLTYSQLNEDGLQHIRDNPDDLFQFIGQTFGPPERFRLGHELHQDGGHHLHCFASWSSRRNSSDPRCFDWREHHPNIEPIRRTPQRAWEYAGKDDDVLFEHGDPPGETGTMRMGREGIWHEALAAEDKEGFLQVLRQGAPREYVLYHEAILRFAERHWSPPTPDYTSPNFEVLRPERVLPWLRHSGIGHSTSESGERKRSLILYGPTRTGKTVWARSLGRYVTASPTSAYPPSPEATGPPTAANPDCPPLSG